MKTVFLLVLVFVVGYSSGLIAEATAHGEDSKLLRLFETGNLTSLLLNYPQLPIFNDAELAVTMLTDMIDKAMVDFTITQITVTSTIDGTPFFRNEITECIFETDDTITFDTCVICKITDGGEPAITLAEGRVDIPFPPGIEKNVIITVPLTRTWEEGARDVRNVHAVIIAVCDEEDGGGEGCTPGFWKQSQHFGHWETFSPSDDYETIFGVDITIKVDNMQETTPTLLQALNAQGGAQNALARHSVAALLNAASSGTSFEFTVAEVIALVQQAFANGTFEQIKNQLAAENERGCPLSGQSFSESEGNSFSETGGVDPAGYTGTTDTPFEKKMYAQSELNNLLTQTTDPITIAELNNAITDLDAIVNNLDYWVDHYHLDIITGQFVLDNSKSAVLALIAITTSSTEPDTFKTSVENVINELVNADMILAQTAVDDVIACGESNPKIANHLSNAQTKLTQAQDDANQKKYDMAIQKFYDAWLEAFLATESCPTGYWTQFDGYEVVE